MTGTESNNELREVRRSHSLEKQHVGDAMVLAARRRAKYVGGERAVYNPELA